MDIGIDYDDWGKKFIQRMKSDEDKLDLSNRKNFAEWMCRQHNYVNKDLGKQAYDCTYENLKKRWGPP